MLENHNGTENNIVYIYKFEFPDGKKTEFVVELERTTLDLIKENSGSQPEWTRLEFNKCPDCPLNEVEHKNCPVAENIVEVIDFFRPFYSYDKVDVEVETKNRIYRKPDIALQKGVSSLLGIYMVTTGCPILGRLKPMVRYHLPFSSLWENSYRVISMYLTAQYFANKRGEEPDWDLKNLTELYNKIHHVNKSFWKRLSAIESKDTSINALIILDTSASHVQFQLDEEHLSEIDMLCKTYF